MLDDIQGDTRIELSRFEILRQIPHVAQKDFLISAPASSLQNRGLIAVYAREVFKPKMPEH
jgi:hypothetical protein